MIPERHGGEVERAEPMRRATSSPVLRSSVVPTGKAEGAGAARPFRAARPALPCLLSNNCTTEEKTEPRNILKGGHKRMAQVLFLESCLFSWNSENAWLWRHKVAAFAKRHGVADLDGMRKMFGPRWAYQRCREILAEPLEGVVFPSFAAAMRSPEQEDAVLMARYKAERLMEELPANRTVLVGDESFNGWPVWAVPASFGEEVASTPLSPEIVAAGEERARELRLYAARIEVLGSGDLGGWA